jgi:hypothetical protein
VEHDRLAIELDDRLEKGRNETHRLFFGPIPCVR